MSRSTSFGNNNNNNNVYAPTNNNNNKSNDLTRSLTFCNTNNRINNNNSNNTGGRSGKKRNNKKNYNQNNFVNNNTNANRSFQPVDKISRFNSQGHYQSSEIINSSISEDNEINTFNADLTQSSCFDMSIDSNNNSSYLACNLELSEIIIEQEETNAKVKEENCIIEKLMDESNIVHSNHMVQSDNLLMREIVSNIETDLIHEYLPEDFSDSTKCVELTKDYVYFKNSQLLETYEESFDKTREDSGMWTNNSVLLDSSLKEDTIDQVANDIPDISNNNITEIENKFNDLNLNKPKDFLNMQNEESGQLYKLVFVGDSAVGKTSFITRYCKNEFSESTSATLGVDFYVKPLNISNENIQLQLWDTCGQERFRSIAKSYFRRADGVVLMYDTTCEQSFINVREWIQSINEITDRSIPIIIIGNKTDLRESAAKNNIKVISYQDGLKFAKDNGALFIETSIKEGTNIDSSLVDLCKQMIIANQLSQITVSTTKNLKFGLNDQKTINFSNLKKRCC